MIWRRIHYYTSGRSRCGQGKNWTVSPEHVTCNSCKRLMKGEVK